MLNALLGLFSSDMGIDLGTANTLVYVPGKGVVINEPSVVAISILDKKVLAVVGSPRKKGNTDLLVDEMLKGAASLGAKTEKIYLHPLKILQSWCWSISLIPLPQAFV